MRSKINETMSRRNEEFVELPDARSDARLAVRLFVSIAAMLLVSMQGGISTPVSAQQQFHRTPLQQPFRQIQPQQVQQQQGTVQQFQQFPMHQIVEQPRQESQAFQQFQEVYPSQVNGLRDANQQDLPHSKMIEAETLRASKSGGTTGAQNMQGFGSNWSGGYQLIWTDNGPGQKLELPFEADADGVYSIVVHMTKANDFGDLSIGMQGRQLATFSGYSTRIEKTIVQLGEVQLTRGFNTLIFNVTGKFSRSGGYRAGIDRIDITSTKPVQTLSGGMNGDFGQSGGGNGSYNDGAILNRPGSDQLNGETGSNRPLTEQESHLIDIIKLPHHPLGGAGGVRLPVGLTLFRLQDNFLTTDGFQIESWDHHSSVLRFRWDATALAECRAVIWQVTTEKPKQVQLWTDSSSLSAIQMDGIVGFGINGRTTIQENRGQFNFDFRKHGHLITDPFKERFYVQLIPINNPQDRKPVGQPSNIIMINPPYELLTFNEDWDGQNEQQQFSITILTSLQNQSEQAEKNAQEKLKDSQSNVLNNLGGGSGSSDGKKDKDDDDDN